AAAAGRAPPPGLVDPSFVRVTSGDLTPGALAAETDRPDVRAVLLATGRLSALPGFRDLVAARFPRVQDFCGGGVLYRRCVATPVASAEISPSTRASSASW